MIMKLRVDDLIKKSGYKKQYVAAKMGVNKDTITNWSKNKSMIRLDQAVKLSKILNCKLEDLYEEE